MFGTARLYASAGLVADVLARHPGVRVELVGQNSSDVLEDLRRGRLEAAMIAVPQISSEGMEVTPVARDELVYVSAHPDRLESPVTAARLARAELVMPETTWRSVDSTRIVLRRMLHESGRNPQTRIEVEDVETAVELVGMGLADTVIPKGAVTPAAAAAGAGRRLRVAAPAPVRLAGHRAPRGRQPVTRRAADDRGRHAADPGGGRAARGGLDAARSGVLCFFANVASSLMSDLLRSSSSATAISETTAHPAIAAAMDQPEPVSFSRNVATSGAGPPAITEASW